MQMKNKKGILSIILGLLLLTAALILSAYNIITENNAEIISGKVMSDIQDIIPEIKNAEDGKFITDPNNIPDYIINPEIPMANIDIDGTNYVAVITIPALGIELPVCSDYSDANLKKAPCRYNGAVYTDDLIVCAHNYKKHFKYLKSLNVGDFVYILDMDGNLFTYKMTELEILDPENVPEFYEGDWDLTLFTCTQSGSQRIVARFDKV